VALDGAPLRNSPLTIAVVPGAATAATVEVTTADGSMFAVDAPLTVAAGEGDDAGVELYLQSRDAYGT
jgi:hypothetical protein